MAAAISALLATWFTPSSLFVVVNIVIGTIAVTSRFASPRNTQTHDSPQLTRSPSLLQRVRSFRLNYYSHNYEHDPAVALSQTVTDCTHPHLVRTPSLLERLRSFQPGHYDYSSESTAFAEPDSTQPQLVRTPSLLERVRSFSLGLHKQETSQAEKEYDEAHQQESESEGPKEPQLARAPSLLQRLQSINLSRIYRSETVHADEELEPEPEGPDSKAGRGSGANVADMMRKSASERAREVRSEWEEDEETVEKRRPETTKAETSSFREDEEVDAKADDFINRFRKQLKLQRVDSLLRYREMLRGN